jgi:hypothetical protein
VGLLTAFCSRATNASLRVFHTIVSLTLHCDFSIVG